jgi:hypothetical protein
MLDSLFKQLCQLVLAGAEAVVRQQLVVDHVLVRANELQNCPDVFLIVVHPRNQRCAGDKVDVRKGLIGFLEVLQNPFVTHPGPLLMPLRDGQLVVMQHGIHVRQRLFDKCPGHIAGRFDCCIETITVGFFQQCGTEIRLKQALTATQGHASS